MSDVLQSFQMNPEQAEIWFGGRRMVLQDNSETGVLRRELIQTVGYQRARALMTRIGYTLGTEEAELAYRLRSGSSIFDLFTAGPQFHAVKGAVMVEPLTFNIDTKRGEFYAEYYWHRSSECTSHLQHLGTGPSPGGWHQVGYASGYSTAIFGRPIIFREVECIAMGHSACFLVGKNAEHWESPDSELQWFRADTYQTRTQRRAVAQETAAVAEEIPQDLRVGSRAIVGASPGFNIVLHLVDRVAPTDAPVLFLGESGVGKEVFARELHKRSQRADQPMLSINCAAIPESLIEAELFGVEKGAYTGADASRPGRFERADGGTLFLDEVGTLSLAAQGKLLRVLQEGEFERVGGSRVRTTNARIIAATNMDLRKDVEQGRFREDLFFRLNVFPIHIPALRDRRADIPLLINHFLKLYAQRHRLPRKGFDGRALRLLMSYHWPGNIRELENVVERSIILATAEGEICHEHLLVTASQFGAASRDPFTEFLREQFASEAQSPQSAQQAAVEQLLDAGVSPQDVEQQLIDVALRRTSGNVSEAARLLGMSRSQVNYRLRQRPTKDTDRT